MRVLSRAGRTEAEGGIKNRGIEHAVFVVFPKPGQSLSM